MLLVDNEYVPTLAVRPSEMNGLEQLPGLTKDRMLPVFLLAPWMTAATLAKAVERAEKAFPDRPYIVDLDRDYEFTNSDSDPQQELQKLLNSEDCFARWWDFVHDFPNARPCLQIHNQTAENVRTQIARSQDLGREFCLRVELSRYPENLVEVVTVLNEIGTADFVVALEGGWTRDPLTLFAQMSEMIGGVLSNVDADVPIVVSCTSMPKEFQDIFGCVDVPFSNRTLVSQIARSFNRRRVFYGDWGSTRPREPSSHRRRPLDRIDYPMPDSWIIARNSDEEWTFRDAAEEVVHGSGHWDEGLNIWGTNMILRTLANPAFGINTPQKNVASRVNIHLHRQAFYGIDDIDRLDFDDDWQD